MEIKNLLLCRTHIKNIRKRLLKKLKNKKYLKTFPFTVEVVFVSAKQLGPYLSYAEYENSPITITAATTAIFKILARMIRTVNYAAADTIPALKMYKAVQSKSMHLTVTFADRC